MKFPFAFARRWFWLGLCCLLLSAGTLSSCRSGDGLIKKRGINARKPIPCPQKDC